MALCSAEGYTSWLYKHPYLNMFTNKFHCVFLKEMQWGSVQKTLTVPSCTVLPAFAFSLPSEHSPLSHLGTLLYFRLRKSQTVCVGKHVVSGIGGLFEARLQISKLTHYVGVLLSIVFYLFFLHGDRVCLPTFIQYTLSFKIDILWLKTL